MPSNWYILFILIYLIILGEGSSLKDLVISFKDLENGNVKENIKVSDFNETLKGSIEYKSKKLKNIKVVRLDMKKFNGLEGVKGKFSKSSSSDYYITIFETENIIKKSDKIDKVYIKCSVETCYSGIVLISKEVLKTVQDIEKNDVEGFFMLFTHNDIFYPLGTINLLENRNPIVKCPYHSQWVEGNDFLEYKQHEALEIYDDGLLNNKFLLYPAIKTNIEKNIMECGSVIFNSKKVLTFGYNLNINGHKKPQHLEIEQMKSLDCSLLRGGNRIVVQNRINKFLYVPISETFNMIPTIQYLHTLDNVKASGVYLIFSISDDNTMKVLDRPICSISIKLKESDLKYMVTLTDNNFINKKLKINNKDRSIKTLEIDISEETKHDFENIKKIQCYSKTFYKEAQTKMNEKIKDYYSLKYKSIFIKLDYNGSNVSIPNNVTIFNSMNESTKYNSFDKFGIYQCYSINSSKKLDGPSIIDKEYEMFMILPKENKEIVEKISKPYKIDLKGEGKCTVNIENFGFLESILFDNNNLSVTVEISNIKDSKIFKYTDNKEEIIYMEEIERKTKLICVYKTNYNIKFKIIKLFDYKTDTNTTTNLINGNSSSKNNNLPIIIAAIFAFGLISVTALVAFLYIKKRKRKRRKKIKQKKRKVKKYNNASSLESSSSNSSSLSISTSESEVVRKNKDDSKLEYKHSSINNSVSSESGNGSSITKSKNIGKTTNVFRFAAK
uniref:6-cysteine protein n=1 Tax=Strongyloides stercoralis TaxID=6248 RepID=A0A0K0ER69_STRER